MKIIVIFLMNIFLFGFTSELVAIFGLSQVERKVKQIKEDIKQEQKKVIASAYSRLENYVTADDNRKLVQHYDLFEETQKTLRETGFMLGMGIIALGNALDEEVIDLNIMHDIVRDVADFSQQQAEDLIKNPIISQRDATYVLYFYYGLCEGGIKRRETNCDQMRIRFQKIIDAKN